MWRRLVRGFWGRRDAGKGPGVLGIRAGAGGRGAWGQKRGGDISCGARPVEE